MAGFAFIDYYPQRFPDQFLGPGTPYQANVTVLDETYELHVPAGFHLTVWTNPRSGVVPSESNANGEHIYRWHRTDLKPTSTLPPPRPQRKPREIRPSALPTKSFDDWQGGLPSASPGPPFPDRAAVGILVSVASQADRIAPDYAAIKAKAAELTVTARPTISKKQMPSTTTSPARFTTSETR